MPPHAKTSLFLPDPDATDAFARTVAPFVTAPCTLLLEGDIGAGKSHFARALMRSLGVTDRDIPSPTFTLVQTYESPAGAIWHSDLYRLSSVEEAEELGLFDAFETAICLVEWPDRFGGETPRDALWLTFEPQGDGRQVTLRSNSETWRDLLETVSE